MNSVFEDLRVDCWVAAVFSAHILFLKWALCVALVHSWQAA